MCDHNCTHTKTLAYVDQKCGHCVCCGRPMSFIDRCSACIRGKHKEGQCRKKTQTTKDKFQYRPQEFEP